METLMMSDLRVAGNQAVAVTSEADVQRALTVRYGAAELDAMLAHDPAAAAFVGDGPTRWSRAAAFLEARAVHEFRQPLGQAEAFAPLERQHADFVVHTVVGLSPTTAWAAVLAAPAGAKHSQLFVRCAHDRDRTKWRLHRGMPRLKHVGAVDVSGEWATVAAGLAVYVVNMAHMDVPVMVATLPEPPVHVASNGRFLAIVFADGDIGVMQLGSGGVARLSLVTEMPQPAALEGAPHPLTGEPLEPVVPAVELMTHRAMRVAFNQLGGDVLVVSTAGGAAIVCAVGETGVTPVTVVAMGPMPSLLEDTRIRHPPQEPAASLCVRIADADGIIAQCGWHLTYRQLADPDVGAPVVPRFPTLFVPDVGPLACVGVCGTTIVTHARNDNALRIGSLVPTAHDPHQTTARFGINGSQWSHPLAGDAAPYASLCVLATVIYCLLPNGALLTLEPTGPPRRTETDVPAV